MYKQSKRTGCKIYTLQSFEGVQNTEGIPYPSLVWRPFHLL